MGRHLTRPVKHVTRTIEHVTRLVKHLTRAVFVICILCAVVPDRCHSESVRIAAENDWIPYARQDGTGLANDIIAAAFKSIGIRVTYDVVPYARVLSYLDSGRYVAGFNVPLDDKSRKRYILGERPLYYAVSAYYESRQKPLTARNRDQLVRGEKIGVVRGYGYGNHYLECVEKGLITAEISNSEASNLIKLALGRLDATIIYAKTARILIRQLDLGAKIQMAFINESTPIYLAFSRAHSKGWYFSAKFDKGMEKIQANGVYQKIMDTY